jgi:16S rRNA (guanine(966)-N(2))-methyltransferase RsmD
MRVIAGQFRSRPLRAPRGMDVRPTSDRLRETLFNVLASGRPDALADTVWIDAFAGTGAVGIEALSRGASNVYFIELFRAATATIRDNLRSLNIEEGFEVLEREVVTALRQLETMAVTCDFCFLDPPYADDDAYEQVLDLLGQSQLLKPSSIVIAEHDKRFDPGEKFGALVRYRRLDQGDASLSFYRLA